MSELKYPIIAPSILAGDLGAMRHEIQELEKAGADWIHIDVMDGSFVPPITFGDNMVTLARSSSSLILDTHLMIQEPLKHFKAYSEAGCHRLTFHLEASTDPAGDLKKIKELGMRSGIAIKPETPVERVEPFLDESDLLLIMTVNPGWSGQKFISDCLIKIEKASSIIERRNLKTVIEVDGGINSETAKLCVARGAQVLVAGSSVLGSQDRKVAIAALKMSR